MNKNTQSHDIFEFYGTQNGNVLYFQNWPTPPYEELKCPRQPAFYFPAFFFLCYSFWPIRFFEDDDVVVEMSKKKEKKTFFVLFVVQKWPAAFCYFWRVFRSKNCFPLKTISRRKKKQELILSGCVWSFLKFGKRQNNCFLRGELSVGKIG